MSDHDRFRIPAGRKVDLADFDPSFKEHHLDKKSAAAETERHTRRLAELQYLLYAEQRRSLLICLQALDAGGKDGTSHFGDLKGRHVVSPISMLGDLIPVMTGVAMGGRYLGQKLVTMTWIGDGGTSTGAFHEGMNLAAAQHASAQRLASLPDDTPVCPTHGFGSFCSATQAAGTASTIGREKRVNPVLTLDQEHYVAELLAELDAYPAYYAHMGPANAAGPGAPDLSPPRRAGPPAAKAAASASAAPPDRRSIARAITRGAAACITIHGLASRPISLP